MRFIKSIGLCSLALMAIVFAPHIANAGQLFPPVGATGNPLVCPTNTLLQWTGDSVKCVGVTVPTCQTGQALDGISNGAPHCVNVTTSVSCPAGQVLASIAGSTPTCVDPRSNFACANGQVLTGISNGEAQCKSVTIPAAGTCGSNQYAAWNGTAWECRTIPSSGSGGFTGVVTRYDTNLMSANAKNNHLSLGIHKFCAISGWYFGSGDCGDDCVYGMHVRGSAGAEWYLYNSDTSNGGSMSGVDAICLD